MCTAGISILRALFVGNRDTWLAASLEELESLRWDLPKWFLAQETLWFCCDCPFFSLHLSAFGYFSSTLFPILSYTTQRECVNLTLGKLSSNSRAAVMIVRSWNGLRKVQAYLALTSSHLLTILPSTTAQSWHSLLILLSCKLYNGSWFT